MLSRLKKFTCSKSCCCCRLTSSLRWPFIPEKFFLTILWREQFYPLWVTFAFPSKRYGWLSVLREKRGSNDQKWGLGAANWWPDKTQPSQISVRRQIENFIHREIRLIFQIETNGFIHIFVPLFYLVGCEETRFHFWCWTLLGRALRWCCWLLSPGFKTLSWLCCWRAFIISNSLSCDVQTFVLEGFQGWRDSWILSSQRVCNCW